MGAEAIEVICRMAIVIGDRCLHESMSSVNHKICANSVDSKVIDLRDRGSIIHGIILGLRLRGRGRIRGTYSWVSDPLPVASTKDQDCTTAAKSKRKNGEWSDLKPLLSFIPSELLNLLFQNCDTNLHLRLFNNGIMYYNPMCLYCKAY